jgi:type II secretory pathway pseudopilin PulG
MSVTINVKGATLLELIIAVSMVTVAVVIISLTFPKASVSVSNNRQHALATRFADNRIQEYQAQSYPYINVTPATDFSVSNTNCDCNAQNLAALPGFDAIMKDGPITYTRRVCINLVDRSGSTWVPTCPDSPLTDATDKGLKNIRVEVSWQSGGKIFTTASESMVAR